MLLHRTKPPVIKEFFIWLGIGLVFLVLQATWFYGEEINPFRLDLVFILIIFLGTLNQFGLGILIAPSWACWWISFPGNAGIDA